MADHPGGGPERPILNESQRRHYAVLLAMLEGTLQEIEQLVEGTLPAGRLTPVEADVPPETAEFLREGCAAVRERVYHLADRLGVPSHPASAARRVYAALISSVVHLEDSTSKKLAGYGTVHPSVGRLVDPAIRELHDRLSALAARVNPASGA